MLHIISSQSSLLASLIFLAAGGIGSLFFRKNDKSANLWGNYFAIVGSIFGLITAMNVLLYGDFFSYSFHSFLPILNFSVSVDKLSAFFVLIISILSLVASVYAIGYTEHFYKKYNIGTLGFFYSFFIAGMLLVVTAQNAIFFLIVWEIMSVASYFLVIFEHEKKDNIKAGSLYFIMTHIGTAFIILAFLLLYRATGSFDFVIMKQNIGLVSPVLKNFIFVCAFIGFGTKAGIIPFHVWLPSAHPAAPTHVSALMSGVMIKTGIYMMIRVFVDMIPNIPTWWGTVVLIIGSVSALFGVLYALAENDIKKLLAYSSIENIGIILLGLGSTLIFLASHNSSLAMLSLVATLFHTFNHAIFKGLLFLGAGSVISQTHSRNMENFGGLIKYMPHTALLFLIGSMAISALPPFNGFFSEWMTFQSLFAGIRTLDMSVQWVFVIAAGALAFTGGLAAACFVKAFGITFLARPRSIEITHAKEPHMALRVGMGILAAIIILVGLFAGKVSDMIMHVAKSISIFRFSNMPLSAETTTLSLKDDFASISALLIFVVVVLGTLAIWYIVRMMTRNNKIQLGRTWDCGTDLGPRMEVTGTGFSRSLITIFRGILRPTQQHSIEYKDANMRYFPTSRTVTFHMKDMYGVYLYNPIKQFIQKISDYVKRIQSGNVNAYITYIFFALIVLLVILVI